MWFDARAALADIRAATPAARAQPLAPTPAKPAHPAKPEGQTAGGLADLAGLAAPLPAERESHTATGDATAPSLHGSDAPSAPGKMVRLDWSGEWVSRDRWAEMSSLERHGPQGRLFCGKCWRLRDRDTALACLNGTPCQ